MPGFFVRSSRSVRRRLARLLRHKRTRHRELRRRLNAGAFGQVGFQMLEPRVLLSTFKVINLDDMGLF